MLKEQHGLRSESSFYLPFCMAGSQDYKFSGNYRSFVSYYAGSTRTAGIFVPHSF